MIRGLPKQSKNTIFSRGITVERELTLFFHFIGFGLIMTMNVAGFILNRQYMKAPDMKSKSAILRTARPIGLMSPFATLLMLITGIGNMHVLGLGIFDTSWLLAKLIFFTVAVICGTLFGIMAKKRAILVQQIADDNPPTDAEGLLLGYDKQMSLFYLVMAMITMMILGLSIYGRLGGQ
jgi:hypothetical protein